MIQESILALRLTPSHIAFARGWANGLDIGDLANRYLAAFGRSDGSLIDLRVAKSILQQVLGDLAAIAQKNNIKGAATLWRQSSRIRVIPIGPTLEDFRESLEYGDDISESELTELYKETFNSDSKNSDQASNRRARLIKRQLDFLNQIQPHVSEPIKLTDGVRYWFSPGTADLLVSGGLHLIQDVVFRILNFNATWFDGIPSIGEKKASLISNFLIDSFGPLDKAVAKCGFDPFNLPGRPIIEPRQVLHLSAILQHQGSSSGNIVESESPSTGRHVTTATGSSIADSLSGKTGQYRSPDAVTDASNDYEAMESWLRLKQSDSTILLYRREVTRLIAWAINSRRKAVSSLTVEDALLFRDFLTQIPPASLVKKGPPRGYKSKTEEFGHITIPGFSQPQLSPKSIKKTLVVINGFYNWLVSVRYLTANPFSGIKPPSSLSGVNDRSTLATDTESLELARLHKESVIDRTLPREVTDAINSYLLDNAKKDDAEFIIRASFTFKFALITGLRISGLAAARIDHLEYISAEPTDGVGGWILHVIEKRNKAREVPIPEVLIDDLKIYLAHRGILPTENNPLGDPGTFLIGAYPSALRQKKAAGDGIRPQAIHDTLKTLFKCVAESATFKDPNALRQLKRSTTHWLRHTSATRAIANDVPLDVVAGILGHSSLTTTSRYIRAERKRKMAEMQRIWNPTT